MRDTHSEINGRPYRRRVFRWAPYLFFALILIILPTIVPSFIEGMLVKFLIFSIMAMSLDLIFGYTGLWSLGHASYFGMAGYTFGLLAVRAGTENFWMAASAGIIISFIFFSILSFLFKTPYIIVVGLLIGYSLFKMYEKYESFRNRY